MVARLYYLLSVMAWPTPTHFSRKEVCEHVEETVCIAGGFQVCEGSLGPVVSCGGLVVLGPVTSDIDLEGGGQVPGNEGKRNNEAEHGKRYFSPQLQVTAAVCVPPVYLKRCARPEVRSATLATKVASTPTCFVPDESCLTRHASS
ncbi:hypothetical protein NDU88_006997 [Pleurodeles waltl]|uniref:Secreted protein n=1 Tax=Pleurodeles waltl TaxID=8319 RepID=A0AAV7PMP3_PLEWA|nr:hypothetical protein NDU88_006997 [Pleurodeles waltl]